MKTRHVASDHWDFANDVRDALREVKSLKSSVRIINCGRGVVILPDTNRKADCTDGEVIKALGLVKCWDKFRLEGKKEENQEEPRQLASIQCEGGVPEIISITPDQVRLLNWLARNDYLYPDLEYQYLKSFKVEEI